MKSYQVGRPSQFGQERRVRDAKRRYGADQHSKGEGTERQMTLREAYDITVKLYGDVLKELAKY